MEKFVCDHCTNHCEFTYECVEGTLADVHNYLCPNGMLSFLKVLLPMNQKKEGMINEKTN